MTPVKAADKLTHAGHINALQTIISKWTTPRVENAASLRVSHGVTSNPISAPTSNNPTAPRVIRATKYMNQQRTQNNPMPTIMEEEVAPPIITPSSNNHLPKWQVNGELICSKRNHTRHASRKRIQTIIDAQTTKDKLMDIRKGVNQTIDEESKNYNNNSPPLVATSLITLHHVNPKGSNSPLSAIPTITQDYPSQHSNHPVALPLLPDNPGVYNSFNPLERTSSTLTQLILLSAAPYSIHIQPSTLMATPLAPPWQH